MKNKSETSNVAQTGKNGKTSNAKKETDVKPAKIPSNKSTVAVTGSRLKPASLNIRTYQVGFGDCFLLTFNYPQAEKPEEQKRHILIDFGSTGLPDGTPADQMLRVAKDIKEQCGEKLHVVVATHRHKDHISGFTTGSDNKGTGDIIKDLNPEVVIQPWTEDPKLKDSNFQVTAQNDNEQALAAGKPLNLQKMRKMQISTLNSMHEVSGAMLTEVQHISDRRRFSQPLAANTAEQIRFLADDNSLPNESAVENLQKMGRKNHYVHHGYQLDLLELLPGIDIKVLGPPTLEQHADIRKERSSDKNEFWMLQGAASNFWQQQALTGKLLETAVKKKRRLFPGADVLTEFIPSHDRWFVRQIRAMRGEQILGLVRILDNAMNNTSVILMLNVSGKKLLFPGDAQIENWEYALSINEDLDLLRDVDVYKVGHHGSRNATPKTLWENFDRKSETATDANRLKTVVSTMEGKHGCRASHSEVPRQTLVDALTASSDFHTTQTAAQENQLFEDIKIDFS